jgi:hypothetical protein
LVLERTSEIFILELVIILLLLSSINHLDNKTAFASTQHPTTTTTFIADWLQRCKDQRIQLIHANDDDEEMMMMITTMTTMMVQKTKMMMKKKKTRTKKNPVTKTMVIMMMILMNRKLSKRKSWVRNENKCKDQTIGTLRLSCGH